MTADDRAAPSERARSGHAPYGTEQNTRMPEWLARGGQEGDLMQQNGWNSPAMVRRYGASAAAERARRHYDVVMGKRR